MTLPAPSNATPYGFCSCPAPLPLPPMTRVGGGALPACMAPDESVRTEATDALCPVSQDQLRDSVLMSLFIAAGYIGQSISLQTLEAGKVGFICSLSVIVCPILEIVFDNKKVSAGLVAAILLSVSGVATLELTG